MVTVVSLAVNQVPRLPLLVDDDYYYSGGAYYYVQPADGDQE